MASIGQHAYDRFFPPKARPYITFKNGTILVLVLCAASAIFRGIVRPPAYHLPPEMLSRYSETQALVRSPLFLVVYNLGLIAGFVAIYISRFNKRYYHLRVYFFTMFLMGAVMQLVNLLVPWPA